MKAVAIPHTPNDWVQFGARTFAVLWAAFWVFFCVASAFGEREGVVGGLIHVIPAVVFIALVLLAWRFELAGGTALVVIAAAAFFFFRVYRQAPVAGLILVGPPCVAGVLFLLHRRQTS